MVVIGGLMLLFAYGVGIYGWLMVSGYAVSFPEAWKATWPGGKSTNPPAGTGKAGKAQPPTGTLGKGVA